MKKSASIDSPSFRAPARTGRLHRPQASGHAGAPNKTGREPVMHSPALPVNDHLTLNRVWTAELRGSKDKEANKKHLTRIREVAAKCAQFGNELLRSNYLLYASKNIDGAELVAALSQEAAEAKGRYKAWGDRLSSYVRDAVVQRVIGLVKARGREVMRGECALPTFLSRGSILVRERGVRLWTNEGRLYCSLKVDEMETMKLDLWVKNLHPPFSFTLDKLLSGEYRITQAQVLIRRGWKVSVRLAYSMEVPRRKEGQVAEICLRKDIAQNEMLALAIGESIHILGYDVMEAIRQRKTIDSRRIQCWRLIRGKRIKKRRARIYRSGTLDRLSNGWQNWQRTWAQQLGAVVAKLCTHNKVGELRVPSPGMLDSWFVATLDWTLVSGSIASAVEKTGVKVTQMRTEEEQTRDMRKLERKKVKEEKKNLEVAER